MGHSRNFVNNRFCVIRCMKIREDHRQKKRWRSFAHLPWLQSALPSPINWPRAPWLVEPLYFRPVCIARSSWGSRKRRLAGVKKTVQCCTMFLQQPEDPLTFSPPSKNKTPHSIQTMFFFFCVCSNPFSHSLPPLCASSTSPGVLRVCAPQKEIQALIGS